MRFLFASIILTFFSCNQPQLEKDAPNCIKRKIKDLQKKEVQNPPAEVWEWKVDGKTYYYITSDCCDQYNYLFNEDCEVVCAPDGGFTGSGDGNCPSFNGTIQKTLIWEDDRD